MKKLLALLLSFIMVLSLAACTGSATTAATTAAATAAATTAAATTTAATTAAATTAAATTAATTTAAAFPKMTIKLGHTLEVTHHDHTASLYFADLVSKKTNGQVTVVVYPAAQLGSEKDLNDAMVLGSLELAMMGIGEAAVRDPALSLFDSAYVFRDRDHLINMLKSDVFKEMSAAAAKTGVRPLSGIYYGTRHLTTSKKAVKTIADMKGLKIRCPNQPVFLDVIKALGAQPSPMAFSEVYLALQQGVVDGQENPVAAIDAMKFYEVQKYLTKTGHIIAADFFLISEKFNSGISPALQKILADSAVETADYINPIAKAEEDKLFGVLQSKGMTIIEPELAAFVEAGKKTHAAKMVEWGGQARFDRIQAIK